MRHSCRILLLLIAVQVLWASAQCHACAQTRSVIRLFGSIDHRHAIYMRLERDGKTLDGCYFYERVGRAIRVEGTLCEDGRIRLDEATIGGETTGVFAGALIQGKRFLGTWKKATGIRSLPVDLSVEPNPSMRSSAPGTAFIVERSLRIRRPNTPDRQWISVCYPVVRTNGDALALRKLNRALSPTAVYDTPIERLPQDDRLNEIRYELDYNRHGILGVTLYADGMGAYPNTLTHNVVLNLKTGNPIRAADVFRADGRQALANLVDGLLQEDLKAARNAYAEDSGIFDLLKGFRFGVKDLDRFTVGERGLTFIMEFGFPHAVKAAEPPGLFFFPYAALRPYIRTDGPLAAIYTAHHGRTKPRKVGPSRVKSAARSAGIMPPRIEI